MMAAHWIVLDNIKRGYNYRTNLNWNTADDAYRWAVENEYIRDGQITPAGEAVLLADRRIEKKEEGK